MQATAIKCRHSRNADGTWNAFMVPLFVTHTRGDIVYDRAYLDRIIRNTLASDRIKGRPKAIVHHGRDRSGPNVGRVINPRRVEDVLFGDYSKLRPAVFKNWAVMDAYPGRSIELDPVSFDRIEAVAFLGNEEPYFPLSPVEFELSEDEMRQLEADVKADTSFAHAYARPGKGKPKAGKKPEAKADRKFYLRRDAARKVAAYLLDHPEIEAVEIEELFTRIGKGELKQYMLEPEDAQDMIAVVEELTAPLKEGIAMLNARLEAVEQQADLEEAKDDGAGDEGQGDEEDPEAEGDEFEKGEDAEGEEDSTRDEEDPDADSDRDDEAADEKDSEREEEDDAKDDAADSDRDDEKEKGMFKRDGKDGKKSAKAAKPAKKAPAKAATSDLATFERLVKAEAKNARHQGEQTFADYQRRIAEVLDPAVEEDVDAKANELTEELYKLSEADRPKGLELVLNAYRDNGVPTGKLPATKKDAKDKPAQGLEARAREYHREWRRVQGKNYQGMKEDDFAKHVVETVENDESGTRYVFLRD
jgi:hypothetical protein